MPIDVICPGCHKRFQVSEKFAGKKGPCPGCNTVIEIPKLEDVVVVHERETTKTGAPAKINSIQRQKTTVSKFELIFGLSTLVLGFIITAAVRMALPEPSSTQLFFMAILAGGLLGIGTSLLGYIVFRSQDTAIDNGRKTLIKVCLVGLAYVFIWRLLALITTGVLTQDGDVILPGVIILAIAFAAMASFLPMALFEFEYIQGLIHVVLFVASLAIYSLILGNIVLIVK